MRAPVLAELAVGDAVGSREISFSRADLIRYAGASGDFNPIHWNERFAREVELPGVIAHGMLTMGAAVELVSDWLGDPGAILDYQTRFTKPVPVPDLAEGAVIEVSGAVGAVDPVAKTARIDLTVLFGGEKVLVKAQALVRLA
ncbi:MaoC family dehydratase [Arthrobacter russicus]|jgi:acyl dehydratase|uniref:Acyl dehydratase n=1 Tax=Arthrobacter russicus TaxID=172040 RepID=A0ABU1JD69_9MICC|nr:MaoC family dehydratase [Arthrobacter russicus]MBQ1444652.1 MaoC family dehydratase [Renibacterium sp.]MDN5667758.1 MaoC family dehydratase [Renibacterium salmoninarum]MDR6270363.1 acyl dehydratase [Arthrobacter russicus]